MDLIFGDVVILGVCLDISESGLRGTFSHPVPVGTEGLLTLYHSDETYQVHTFIDSFRNDEVRARFRFESEQERLRIRGLIKLLTGPLPPRR